MMKSFWRQDESIICILRDLLMCRLYFSWFYSMLHWSAVNWMNSEWFKSIWQRNFALVAMLVFIIIQWNLLLVRIKGFVNIFEKFWVQSFLLAVSARWCRMCVCMRVHVHTLIYIWAAWFQLICYFLIKLSPVIIDTLIIR